MEICSGSGEWAVARAKSEMGSFNWVANEIRFERCYDIWARTVFQGKFFYILFFMQATFVSPCSIQLELGTERLHRLQLSTF